MLVWNPQSTIQLCSEEYFRIEKNTDSSVTLRSCTYMVTKSVVSCVVNSNKPEWVQGIV
jgi:hypothetical protein